MDGRFCGQRVRARREPGRRMGVGQGMAKHGVEVILRWEGEILVWEHTVTPGSPLAGAVALPELPEDGSWVLRKEGALLLRARRAPLPRYRDPGGKLDRGLAWSMTAAMTLGIAFLLLVGFAPPAGATIALGPLTQSSRLLAYVRAPRAERVVLRDPLDRWGSGPITDDQGRPMEEEAGVSGATDGPQSRRGRIRFRGDDEVVRRIPREVPNPRQVGILGVLASFDAERRAGALAGEVDATGWTRDEAFGRPLAQLVGLGHGADGFDMVGTGRGGCWPGEEGCGEGTVGLGRGLGFGGIGRGTTCNEVDCVVGTFGSGVAGGFIPLGGRAEGTRRHRTRGSRVPDAMRRLTVAHDEGLSREQVRRALAGHRDAIRHCYARAEAAAGGETGAVEIGLAIAPDGHVLSSGVVTDTLADDAVASCIASVLSRARFPQAPASTVASVPFGLGVFGGS